MWFQMTTGRWLIAVAVFSIVIGGIVGLYCLKRWRRYFLGRAHHHLEMESRCREQEGHLKAVLTRSHAISDELEEARRSGRYDATTLEEVRVGLEQVRERLECFAREIAYHAAMARKYQDAARRPWLPAEPDPPESR